MLFCPAAYNFTKCNTSPHVLFTFCNETNDPKLQNTPDFWLENKMFHNNLCVFIIISALLYLLHLLSLHKSLVYPAFIYILYDEFSKDGRGEYSSAKYAVKN